MKIMMTAVKITMLIGVIAAFSGCAKKYVAQSTGTQNQTKFLYIQGKKSGIIKCDNDASGALNNCREMEIINE